MYYAILLFNQCRQIVSKLHYLAKKDSLEGSKNSVREQPSKSRGLGGILEAPHKYRPWKKNAGQIHCHSNNLTS